MKKVLLIVAALAGLPAWGTAAETKVDFAKDIQPILQKTCIECHGPEKPKGKLRLDSKDLALRGGGDGPVIAPGHADQSELYRRIILPTSSDDVMPNKGDLLTQAQTDLIRDWINQGAIWPDGIVIAAMPAKSGTTAGAESELPDYQPTAAELKALKALDSLGIAVRPVAANLNWREVNFRAQALETGAVAKALVPLGSVLGLYELNLGGVRIADADLENIKGLVNLRRLHLENTAITDAGLKNLKPLVNLTYLNLYGTAITDSGLEQLEGLTHLKKLYLWQTKTTEAGVTKFKQALPQVDVSTGAEYKALAVKVEKPEEQKDAK